MGLEAHNMGLESRNPILQTYYVRKPHNLALQSPNPTLKTNNMGIHPIIQDYSAVIPNGSPRTRD